MSSASPSPAVSVVLPTHNRRDLLPRAVASVLAQTLADLELIIVDDGSSDGTAEWVSGLSDPRVVYLPLGSNRGQSVARNAGLRAARASLVAYQDSDDEWVPDKLAEQVDVLRKEPGVAMVYGDLLRIPYRGEPYRMEAPDLKRGQVFDERPTLYAAFGIGVQTCLFRRRVLCRLGGFDERLRCFEDLDLFMRMLWRYYRLRRIPRVLVRYWETEGVSKVRTYEKEARYHFLRRYRLGMFFHRPGWRQKELESIEAGRLLGE